MSSATPSRVPQLLIGAAIVLAALAIALSLGTGTGSRGGSGVEGGEGVGQPMPDVTLASLGGTPLNPKDFAGRVVLYDFWATWCGPCHLQADVLREIYPRQAGKGVEFVAIATGEETSVVREYVASRPMPYPVASDPEEAMGSRLGIEALPTLIVMDRRGRIAFRHVGYADAETIEEALARAGAG